MSASLKYKNASWRVSYNTLLNSADRADRSRWCQSNCKHWWCWMSNGEIWLFESKEEATQFYLTWM